MCNQVYFCEVYHILIKIQMFFIKNIITIQTLNFNTTKNISNLYILSS